jgi:hypothetical protein
LKHRQRFEIFVAIVIRLRNALANGRPNRRRHAPPAPSQACGYQLKPIIHEHHHSHLRLGTSMTILQVLNPYQLEHVDRGLLRKSVDEIMVVDHTSHDDGQWDVDILMSSICVSQ